MSDPIIAGKNPVIVKLEKGTHYWCSCGHSDNQPYCDGAHKGTGMEPLEFSIDEAKEVALCMCKQTKNPPYCDGSHNNL